MCPEHLSGEASWRHPDQMSEPTRLAPLNAKQKGLCSEFPPDVWAPHPISKANPSHSPEAPHLCRLYPGSCSFGHNPQLTTAGEGRTVDRPVNWELRLVARLFLHHRFRCSAWPHIPPQTACTLITPSSHHKIRSASLKNSQNSGSDFLKDSAAVFPYCQLLKWDTSLFLLFLFTVTEAEHVDTVTNAYPWPLTLDQSAVSALTSDWFASGESGLRVWFQSVLWDMSVVPTLFGWLTS